MEPNLTTQASTWKDEADKLLADSGLLSMLQPFGTAKLAGSYTYNLMLNPDIDIQVAAPMGEARDQALATLHKLIGQNYWNGYLFYDFANHPSIFHASYPKAYYVGLKADYNQHRWKVDIWFGDENVLSQNNAWIQDLLTDTARQSILNLKQARNNGLLHAESIAIYTAVLQHNIHTIDDFLTWQRNTKTTLA